MVASASTLHRLADTDLTVAEGEVDVRGKRVLSRDGDELGHVDDLLIDDRERKVRFLDVSSGGFLGIGKEHVLIPVEVITGIDEDEVRVDRTLEEVGASPIYDPALAKEHHWTDVYAYYGYGPFWGGGVVIPPLPVDEPEPEEVTAEEERRAAA